MEIQREKPKGNKNKKKERNSEIKLSENVIIDSKDLQYQYTESPALINELYSLPSPPNIIEAPPQKQDLPSAPPPDNIEASQKQDLPTAPPPKIIEAPQKQDLSSTPPPDNIEAPQKQDLPTAPPPKIIEAPQKQDLPTAPPQNIIEASQKQDLPTAPPPKIIEAPQKQDLPTAPPPTETTQQILHPPQTQLDNKEKDLTHNVTNNKKQLEIEKDIEDALNSDIKLNNGYINLYPSLELAIQNPIITPSVNSHEKTIQEDYVVVPSILPSILPSAPSEDVVSYANDEIEGKHNKRKEDIYKRDDIDKLNSEPLTQLQLNTMRNNPELMSHEQKVKEFRKQKKKK